MSTEDDRVTLDEILNMDPTEVDRPKPLPAGNYEAQVVGHPKHDRYATGTEYIEYTLKMLRAKDGVDPEALEKSGGLEDRTMRLSFPSVKKMLYRHVDFLIACGIKEEKGKGAMDRMMSQAPNCRLIVRVSHTPSKTEEGVVYANIVKTMPL